MWGKRRGEDREGLDAKTQVRGQWAKGMHDSYGTHPTLACLHCLPCPIITWVGL